MRAIAPAARYIPTRRGKVDAREGSPWTRASNFAGSSKLKPELSGSTPYLSELHRSRTSTSHAPEPARAVLIGYGRGFDAWPHGRGRKLVARCTSGIADARGADFRRV